MAAGYSWKVSFYDLVLCVLGLGLVMVGHVAHAQDSIADYLNAHKPARSAVRIPNLVWDETVASFARNYANKRKRDCELIHSGGGGRYGENLAKSTGELSGREAVRLWVKEKPYYDYNSNTCIGGECRHYTQVVWRNTVRVGCAKVICDNGRGTFITCSYHPPGNYAGQRPY